MDQNQPGSAFRHRRTEHLPRMDQRGVQDALRHQDLAHDAVARVEQERMKLFLRKIAKSRTHAAKHVRRAAHEIVVAVVLRGDTPAQFERRSDPCRGRAPHARKAFKFRDVEGGQATERSVDALADGLCNICGRDTGHPAPDYHRKQFSNGKAAWAQGAQSFSRSVGVL